MPEPNDRNRDKWRTAVELGEADRDAVIDSLIDQAAALAAQFRATLTDAQERIRRAITEEGHTGES